jgi:hypothetical protein
MILASWQINSHYMYLLVVFKKTILIILASLQINFIYKSLKARKYVLEM